MIPSVANLFAAAANLPSSQLVLNHRVRSTILGDALVQTAIELDLKYKLDCGLIQLVSPNIQLTVNQSEPQDKFCAGCSDVQCLVITPISDIIDLDDIKLALSRQGIKCFSIRKFTGGVEVCVEYTPNIYRVLKHGLKLPNLWSTRVWDASIRGFHKYYCGPLRCLLCGKDDHIRATCFRQLPNCVAALGG